MHALEPFVPLFRYPEEGYAAAARRCAALTRSEAAEAFAAAVQPLSIGELQELFVRTFDLTPASTLEIGWHLFGDQYERGEFLVDLRRRLREAGIVETGELPDHLLHVLPLLGRMAPDDAASFSARFLAPALAKLRAAVPEDNPFAQLLAALAGCLTASTAIAAGDVA